MRYFLDTEYIERGTGKPIDLISIGIVAEDGREFYAISTEFKYKHASEWVRRNVLDQLPERNLDAYDSPRRQMEACAWMSRRKIADEFIRFVGTDTTPEFWGWCCGFDYVVVCQLIGFDLWPSYYGYYFQDIQQEIDRSGVDISEVQRTGNHTAIEDAREIKRLWEYLTEMAP